MSIKITVGEAEPKAPPIKIDMQISKLLNNDYYIPSHSLVDIIIQRAEGKVLTIPKDEISDQVYGVQDRFFSFLSKHGIIDMATIQGGNIYGSIEGVLLGDEKEVSEQAAILIIKKFLDEEKPLEELERDLEREKEMELLLPDDDKSTELGDVPHHRTKGTLQQTAMNPIGGAYFFENKQSKSSKKEK